MIPNTASSQPDYGLSLAQAQAQQQQKESVSPFQFNSSYSRSSNSPSVPKPSKGKGPLAGGRQITRNRASYSCHTCRRRKVKCDKVF